MPSLADYAAKRDFSITPEPPPDASLPATTDRPRFVVQEHHSWRPHWDFRLEHEGVLASWAVPRGLPRGPGLHRVAVRTEDHPLAYLGFEGEIPKGCHGAGAVKRWDQGTFDVSVWKSGAVVVDLHGTHLEGRYVLIRTRADRWIVHHVAPPTEVVRQRVSSGSPWEPVIGFSRAVRVRDRVVVAGTAPVWPDGSCDPDPAVQARRCLEIIGAALAEAGANLGDVVRTRMYLTDGADVEAVGEVHGRVFADVRPAATILVVAGLADPRWKVEIEAEAIVG